LNIEKDIFKRTSVILNKLIEYGFNKIGNNYIFEKDFLNNEFRAIVSINSKGIVNGRVIDLQTNIEYTNIRIEMTG